jgi:hypothetical protein
MNKDLTEVLKQLRKREKGNASGFNFNIDEEGALKLRGKDGHTPQKGVDYWTPEEVDQMVTAIFNAAKPKKGVDYYTDAEKREFIAQVLKFATPVKGRDYRDGIDGKDGRDGKDADEIDPRQVAIDAINYLETFEGDARLSAKALKDLDEAVTAILQNGAEFSFTEKQVNTIKDLLPKYPPMNAGGSGATFLKSLRDVDLSGLTKNADGKYILGGGSGSSTFLALTDTPSSYAGQAGKVPVVNIGETALEFVAPTGTGTVTSVAVSGSDGIEVDSGSPITAAGTIALGLNKATTLTFLNVADGAQVNAIDSVTDTSEIDLAITAKALSATIVAGSIDETKLDASVNASLDLADSAIQPGDALTTLSGDLPFSQIEQIATNRILGRSTAGTGDIEALTAATARDVIGVDTDDSPQFAGVNIGHATDTTITRASAGVIAVEGNNVATITSGAGAPASTPGIVGQIYIDTTNDDAYIAVGTASSADWEKTNDGAGGGTGDVVGPASATNNAIARFDTTTGKLLQDGTISASDVVTGAVTLASIGNNDLVLQTGNASTSVITLTDGANGDITLAPQGGGEVVIQNTSLSTFTAINGESIVSDSIDFNIKAESMTVVSGVGVVASNTTNAAAVEVLSLNNLNNYGGRGTAANNDTVYQSFKLKNSAASLAEMARVTAKATDITSTSEDGQLEFSVTTAGSLATEAILTGTALYPSTNDGNALGTTANQWSDLFLAEGGVINWDNGDVTMTQTGNEVAIAGGVLKVGGLDVGVRTIAIQVSGSASGDSALATGDGLVAIPVDTTLNGMNLVAVKAYVTTVSSSGAPLFQVRRSRRSSNTARTIVDMLTTGVSIDASEFESADAATAAVIDTSNDDVQTGDVLLIDCDTAGTGTKGAQVLLTFQLP